MRFGRLPVHEAEGAILAHSLSVPGRRLRKGHVLTPDDIALIQSTGQNEVWAARLDSDDMPEDQAAAQIAQAACGPHVGMTAAFTGRANVHAEKAGLCLIKPAQIDGLNAIHEGVTIATLPPFHPVEAGDMLATIKIIPFSVPRAVVAQCLEAARQALSVAPFKAMKAGLVMTRLSDTKPSVLEKTRQMVAMRLERWGSALAASEIVGHDDQEVADAIRRLKNECDLILLFGASAIVDRADVLPAGLVAAGGQIERFGMPVDPGNLILTGRLGEIPVIAAPGCARSPKLNGFDWVLWRALAGLPIGDAAIAGMGVGGLLTETPDRGLPRAEAVERKNAPPRKPRLAAILLAAGQSRRMGDANKLLLPVKGKPMVRLAAETLKTAGYDPILVVTGHDQDQVTVALADLGLRFVHNSRYDEGLATSLQIGIAQLPEACDGFLIMQGDMPRIQAEDLKRLAAAFNPTEGRALIVPTFKGKRGNPVLWAANFKPLMMGLSGDVGAKHLIGEYEDRLAEVEMTNDAALTDIDTPQEYQAFINRHD